MIYRQTDRQTDRTSNEVLKTLRKLSSGTVVSSWIGSDKMSGWFKYDNGILCQFGRANLAGTGKATFWTPFAKEPIVVMSVYNARDITPYISSVSVQSSSTTGFSSSSNESFSVRNWFAFGLWK